MRRASQSKLRTAQGSIHLLTAISVGIGRSVLRYFPAGDLLFRCASAAGVCCGNLTVGLESHGQEQKQEQKQECGTFQRFFVCCGRLEEQKRL
jgi:hypothetical protein